MKALYSFKLLTKVLQPNRRNNKTAKPGRISDSLAIKYNIFDPVLMNQLGDV